MARKIWQQEKGDTLLNRIDCPASSTMGFRFFNAFSTLFRDVPAEQTMAPWAFKHVQKDFMHARTPPCWQFSQHYIRSSVPSMFTAQISQASSAEVCT